MANESAADHPTAPDPTAPDPRAPDPRALRALAHPLRWQLIDLIGSETTATATRCAQVLGESVASCSYHLGILGKYGYIELVPGQAGKEKPWRLVSRQQDLDPGGLGTESALAAEAAAEAFLDHELARIKQRLRHLGLEPESWRAGSVLIGNTTWLTAEELREVTGKLKQLLLMNTGRAADPESRPPGAREVRLFAVTSVAPPVTPPKNSAPQA
jgi:Helix-turn-helix domain